MEAGKFYELAAGAVVGDGKAKVFVGRIDIQGKAEDSVSDIESKNPKFHMDGAEEMTIGTPKVFRLSMALPKLTTNVKVIGEEEGGRCQGNEAPADTGRIPIVVVTIIDERG